jgi:RNA polymerase sigma-B factor
MRCATRARLRFLPQICTEEIPTTESVYASFEKLLELFDGEAQNHRVVVSSDPILDLVDRHLPLVRSLARRYRGSGEPFDDLVQVGSVGLVAAARRFDPSRGIQFAAYATPTVEGELRRYLRDRAATIRVPRREQERAAMLRRAAQLAAQRLGHEASLAETAQTTGIPLDDARRALNGSAGTVPLSTLERRASPAAEDEFAACEDKAFVTELVMSLAPRERQLVRLRFGGDLSQAEIAQRLDISQSQASRLLAAVLEKLRHSAEAIDHRAA